jgi:putative SOS response-associated peptidase YedK
VWRETPDLLEHRDEVTYVNTSSRTGVHSLLIELEAIREPWRRQSFTIITPHLNMLTSNVHNRIPVVLEEHD